MGDGTYGSGVNVNSLPKAVTRGPIGNSQITSIAAGGAHSIVVASGRVYTWGTNSLGALGDGSVTTPSPSKLYLLVIYISYSNYSKID
jgi:alpha-tubulin suppressor-like RCC1 family protein